MLYYYHLWRDRDLAQTGVRRRRRCNSPTFPPTPPPPPPLSVPPPPAPCGGPVGPLCAFGAVLQLCFTFSGVSFRNSRVVFVLFCSWLEAGASVKIRDQKEGWRGGVYDWFIDFLILSSSGKQRVYLNIIHCIRGVSGLPFNFNCERLLLFTVTCQNSRRETKQPTTIQLDELPTLFGRKGHCICLIVSNSTTGTTTLGI